MTESRSRTMWELVERFHALCYTAPEVRETATAVGLKGFWMNYFATRAAPLGAVSPEAVESLFFYYAPARVHRALPDAWALATPEAVVDARMNGMQAALARVIPDRPTLVKDNALTETIASLEAAAARGRPVGRALFAGWASVTAPADELLRLWLVTTVLREHRSGSHLLALAVAELDGCESIVSHVAAGGAPDEWIADEARWGAEEIVSATERLRTRGWLSPDGTITDAGRRGREQVEAETDRLDECLWASMSDQEIDTVNATITSLIADFPPDDQLDWAEIYD